MYFSGLIVDLLKCNLYVTVLHTFLFKYVSVCMCNNFSMSENQFVHYLKPCAFFHKFSEGLEKPGYRSTKHETSV